MEIKNHEILHEINRGPITTVYKARHLNLDRPVLLKVLNPQWLDEEDLLGRFKREAQISARLEHPNIVKVYDFTVSPELVFISLEYIDGCSLQDFIKQHHPVPSDIIQNIVKDMLSAVHFAHQNNIIHRDIKPANILIDNNNKAYLTDFGLAAIQDIDTITQQGQIAGTPAYLAPERVKGQQASKASDLYSLGITIYELLTAVSPFRRENTAATLQSLLTGSIPQIATDNQPDWLVQLVGYLTHHEPGSRNQYTVIYDSLFSLSEVQNQTIRGKKKFYDNKWLYAAIPILLLLLFAIMTDSDPRQGPQDSILSHTFTKNFSLADKEQAYGNSNSPPVQDIPSYSPVQHEKDSASHITALSDSATSETAVNILKTGGLYILCTPWANVYIDNDSMDTTPMQRPLWLGPGHYQLMLKNPNYADQTQTIQIKAGITDTLSFKLKETYGYLFIQASPWAKIFINNEYREDTPLLYPILVRSGQNIIELVNPQYQTIHDTVFVAAGKRIQKQYTFAE